MPKRTRFPVLRAEWPRIIDYRTNGIGKLMVDARPHFKREYFSKVGDARTRADQLATVALNRGTEAFHLSTENRVMAVDCMAQLRPFKRTLRDATNFYTDWLK